MTTVTAALSALREKALACRPGWVEAEGALIAALCDVVLGVEDQERRYGLLTGEIRLARNHLAAVIKETGNG